jgi:tetraacyldisaccharide 4'-kinase
MRTPKFWYSPRSDQKTLPLLLAPLGWLYAHVTANRVAQAPTLSTKYPVVCVGNLNAGGTGKTPTVIAIAQICQDLGARVCIVSRGYRGSLTGPIEVDPRTHRADETGDEPLLLAAFASTIVSKDRAKGVLAAMALEPDIILLDDGHQDPSVEKNLSIVVVDAEKGFGNGLCLPAGPLREPVSQGLKRADFLLSIGDNIAQSQFLDSWANQPSTKHFTAKLSPLETGMTWSESKYVAFAGIGHPEKFFAALESLGAQIVHHEALGDHERLSPALLGRLKSLADQQGAQLVTTEKDAARLPDSFRSEVLTLPVRLVLDQPDAVKDIINRVLKSD